EYCATAYIIYVGFFFQAEDGIRDFHVTGVQTCALPILEQIGKDVIGGFIQGLKEKYKELRDYWRDIVESMPRQLKNLLRISSPSKVMVQLGEWTGEGFAVGLQRSMASIMRQAEAIAEVATAASSLPAVATTSAGPSQTPVINIYMEGLLAGANFGPAYTDTDREQLAREI